MVDVPPSNLGVLYDRQSQKQKEQSYPQAARSPRPATMI